MGGVDWSYFVRYQDDVEKAFQELRQNVFDRGDFEHPCDALDGLNDQDSMGFLDSMEDRERQNLITLYGVEALTPLIARVGLSGLRAEVYSLCHASQLSSLADLEALRCLSTSGTRSIRDMTRLAEKPASGAVVPLAASEQVRLFGTDKPTRQMIEDESGFYDKIERGQGLYIIAYKKDTPIGILFAGYSYD